MLKSGTRNLQFGTHVALVAALVGLFPESFLLRVPRVLRGGEVTAAEPLWDTGTFSILGYDAATGEVGGAVQSRVFSVGNGVLWAEANVGVVATQAIVDVSYGPQALALLRAGVRPDAIIKQIWDKDPDPLP